MEGAEDHKEGSNEENGNTEEATSEQKPDLDASETGKGESSSGGENGESHQSPAIDDLADGHKHEDESADETRQPSHQPPTGADKPQTKRPDRRTDRRVSLTVEELKEEWRIQKSEINSLDEGKKRAEEVFESFREQNEAQRDALAKELSDVKKSKTQLELEKEELQKELDACFVENDWLKDSKDDLRQRLQLCVAEALRQMSTKDRLTKTNEGLHKDLGMAKVELKEREKAIEDLEATVQNFTADKMRSKVLQEEVNMLKNELSRAGKQNKWLRAQLRDMTTELHKHPAPGREDERTFASLDDEAQASVAEAEGEERSASLEYEMGETEGLVAVDQDEKAKQIFGDGADSTTGIQISGPDADADKSSTDMQTVVVPSAPSTQTQEPKVEVGAATTGAKVVKSKSPQGERPSEGSISSPDIMQTGDTSTVDTEIEAENFEVSNKSMQPVGTPGKETDFGLSEKHLASPISGTPVEVTGPLSAAEGNTLKLINGKLVPSLDSLVWVLRTLRLAFRFGTAEPPVLDSAASNAEKGMTSKDRGVDIDGNRTGKGGQTEDQSTQTRTADGKLEEDKRKSSIAAAIPYSSIAWWMLLLGLALSWWLSEDHKQLWMQANEMTRRTVVGLRDERRAEPPWLVRMSFAAENVLQIDRSRFA